MSFSKIQDQETALRLLRNIVGRNRVPNGLLFWGPEGVGKESTALEFIKAVNCRDSANDACDRCLSCRKTMHENHGDVKVVTPAGKTRIIKKKAIEEIVDFAMFRPIEGGHRVFLIKDADRMNERAQNYFLKTLEEPPSQSVFVLVTQWPRHLLPTIRSRCQRVRFGALRPDTIASMLKVQAGCDETRANALAALSQGSMARALELVNGERRDVVLNIIHRLACGEDPLLLSETFAEHIRQTEKAIANTVKQETTAPAESDLEEDATPDKEALEALIAGLVRREMIEHLGLFSAWYRDELVHSMTSETQILFNLDHLGQLAQGVDAQQHTTKLQAISDAWKYIERNIKTDRIFRDLFFELAS